MIYEALATGDYFLFFCLVSTHLALLVDALPLQQHMTTKFNFIIAIFASSLIPSFVAHVINFPSPKSELLTGLGICVLLTIAFTLTIERVSPIKLDF